MRTTMLDLGMCALALTVGAGSVGGADVDGVVVLREGAPNLALSLPKNQSSGDRARIVYFGGGGIHGAGASAPAKAYRSQVTRKLRRAFPERTLVDYDKGLQRTGSWLGAFRTESDVVRHYIPLKLVVVDTAADDQGMPENRVKSALEGIVRQIRGRHKYAEILFVYSPRQAFMDDYASGKTPDVIRWHEEVAQHYGISSVNVARAAASRIADGDLTVEEVSVDGLQLTDTGHALCAAEIETCIDQCKAMGTPAELIAHDLPEPLTARPLVAARQVTYEKGELEEGWLGWQESPIELFFHVVQCNRPGPLLSLRFRGGSVGYFDALGPDSGDLEYSIDGGDWQLIRNYDAHAATAYRAHAGLFAENLDPDSEHVLRVRVAAAVPEGSGGRWARIGKFLVDGEVVYDDPLAGKSPLERIDGIWSRMEPVTYVPSTDRWQHLSRTMNTLRKGPELTIVMLGDSIVNDTAHSHFEHLLMRLYPNCTVHKKVSVRGSTGCWWYKEEGRVKTYVLDHDPDLVMIGGISQRNDIESIRDVIHQVRAAKPDTEFLLMTGPFGRYDPRKDSNWRADIDPEQDGYDAELMRLAKQEACEFFHIRGAWGTYIRDSEWAMGAFKRDHVHANDRGKQILGHLLATYFSPKE